MYKKTAGYARSPCEGVVAALRMIRHVAARVTVEGVATWTPCEGVVAAFTVIEHAAASVADQTICAEVDAAKDVISAVLMVG